MADSPSNSDAVAVGTDREAVRAGHMRDGRTEELDERHRQDWVAVAWVGEDAAAGSAE
jgi:hypothetical protein